MALNSDYCKAATQTSVQFLPIIRAQFDNGILGDPYVNCGGNNIEVRFDTRNPFRGIVFVEDHLEDPECRSAPIEDKAVGARNASIRLNFKNCGLEKRRSVSAYDRELLERKCSQGWLVPVGRPYSRVNAYRESLRYPWLLRSDLSTHVLCGRLVFEFYSGDTNQ